MTALDLQVCATCGRAAFPARLACPSCGGRALRLEPVASGRVEELTVRRSATRQTATLAPNGQPAAVASVRTALGPVVIAWSPEVVPAGSDVELTLELGVPVARLPGGTSRAELREAPRTVPALLELRAAELGQAPCLEIGGAAYTFAGLRDAVAGQAGVLVDAGVGPGDRVAVLAENCWELIACLFGAAWAGAIAVPVNPGLRGAQLAHVLADSAPRILAVQPELVAVLPELPRELERIWTIGGAGVVHVQGIPCGPFPAPGAALACPQVGPGDTAALLYTSGTTGPAKGVCCPQAQLTRWGESVGRMLDLGRDDVLYTCLPLFHVNALATVMQGLVYGCRVVVGPRFSSSRFWERVAAADATVTYLLGAIVSILARTEPGPADRGHRLRVALAPATPPELYDVFRERFGLRLVDAFGMTEANAVIGPLAGHQRPGTMGWPLPGYAARVVDAHDDEVADGTPGELVLRADAPYAFASGYWRLPEQTLAAWRNLWLHTGDRVVRDADGAYRFVDRLGDAIRRRGENISAWEVEQALLSHPDVAAAAAVAVPAELGEDDVLAVIVPRAGSALEPAELVRHCEGRIAAFALPRYVELVAALPLTESGKVRKHVLRERGVTAATWDRERPEAAGG